METPRIRKSRASSSDEARRYRQQGHDDALAFALAIGLNEDYKNDAKAKKDVIDPSGRYFYMGSTVLKAMHFLE
jgi:hypothetical protein